MLGTLVGVAPNLSVDVSGVQISGLAIEVGVGCRCSCIQRPSAAHHRILIPSTSLGILIPKLGLPTRDHGPILIPERGSSPALTERVIGVKLIQKVEVLHSSIQLFPFFL